MTIELLSLLSVGHGRLRSIHVLFFKWQPKKYKYLSIFHLLPTWIACSQRVVGPTLGKWSRKLESKCRHMHIRARNQALLVVFHEWVCHGCGNPPQTLK
jgi:hypothetical protein